MNAETIYLATKKAMDDYFTMYKDSETNIPDLSERTIASFENHGFHKPLVALYRLNMEARKEVYRKSAKASNKPSLAAVKRFLNGIPDFRIELKKAWWADGLWWLCDGYRLVGLKEAVDTIPTYDPEYDKYNTVNLGSFTKPLFDGTPMEELAIPAKLEIKAAISAWKENRTTRTPHIYVGENEKIVDAKFLLDMVEILPQAQAYKINSSPISYIYFKDDDGNVGILLPIRPD